MYVYAVIESGVVHATSVSGASCEERDQVERLLADPLFSQSKRCGSFLRYVTERALRNAPEPLTERSLGIEIFGRPQHYDTDADPIVRVTASEVRKRLTQYYDDPAHSGEIRVVVHKGSYQAEFLAAGAQPPTMDASGLQAAAVTPTPAAESAHRYRWYPIVGVVAVAGLAVLAFLRVARSQPSAFELFWAPIIDGPRDVVLSIPQFSDHVYLDGVGDPKLNWSDALTPKPDDMGVSWTQYSKRLVHVSDLSVAVRLSEFLGSKGKHSLVKGEHDLTMGDLRETPAVILGGLINPWTKRLLPQARFSFDGEGTLRFIRDGQNPASRDWGFDSRVPSGSRDKDLIIISRVADSLSGRVTVLAGGFSAWGTEAAVELLTDPVQMEAVLSHAPQKWNAKNVQIALECTVVNRQAGIPRLLAAHFW